MDRVEDFNLALGGQIEVGLSPAVLTATAAGRARARGSLGGVFPSGFWVASATGETRYQDGPRNAIVTADAKGFLLHGMSTLVAHFGVASGWRLDPEVQIYLDGERGVRGYRLHAVSGTGRFVMNLEYRQEFFPDVLNLVSFGAVAFIDSGLRARRTELTLADFGPGPLRPVARRRTPSSVSTSAFRIRLTRRVVAVAPSGLWQPDGRRKLGRSAGSDRSLTTGSAHSCNGTVRFALAAIRRVGFVTRRPGRDCPGIS
jgi:hypothetical protein